MMKKEHENLLSVFSRAVIEKVSEEGCLILEAITELIPEYGIDEEEVGKFLSENLKERLRLECQKNYLFKPSQKIPSIEEYMS